MSYHHTNRIRDHLNPILEPGFKGEFGGKERKKKLSPATQNLLWQIGARLNEGSGSWRVSYALLQRSTSTSTSVIQKALAQLVALGFLNRIRSTPRAAFEYKLGWRLDCPRECKNLEQHMTNQELQSWLSSKQEVDRSTSQSTNALPNRTPKENKETKKKVTACSFCRVEPETVQGLNRKLHSDNCQELARIMSSQGWQIAINNFGEAEWSGLSSKDQQRAYWEDLARGLHRKRDKLDVIDREKQKRGEELLKLIGDSDILPGWLCWLRKRIEIQPIKEQEVDSAKKYSHECRDLIPGVGAWESGAYFTNWDIGPAQ